MEVACAEIESRGASDALQTTPEGGQIELIHFVASLTGAVLCESPPVQQDWLPASLVVDDVGPFGDGTRVRFI